MKTYPSTGKRPKVSLPQTKQLSRYIDYRLLPPPPSEVSWITKNKNAWPMYFNDVIGDCVAACMGHMVQQSSTYGTGLPVVLPPSAILKVYEDVGGYVPDDPNNPTSNQTDAGMSMQDALQYWKTVGIGGHKILGWAEIDPTNMVEMFWGIQWFGNAFVGLALPNSAQGEGVDWTVQRGGVYPPNNQPGSWGGHCVPYFAASPFSRTFISWAQEGKLSPNFHLDYCDELYTVLMPEWVGDGRSPGGLALADMLSDLSKV